MGLTVDGKEVYSDDPATITALRRSRYGRMNKGRIFLDPVEALYLVEARAMQANSVDLEQIDIFRIVSLLASPRDLTRYFVYRDWRERGLAIGISEFENAINSILEVDYPVSKLSLGPGKLKGKFFSEEMTAIVSDPSAQDIYEDSWFGQYGTYKAHDRGQLLKLDAFETLFLVDHGLLELDGIDRASLLAELVSRRPDFPRLYEVYADWRKLGYIIKTGFKFGTHFRVYFPGAKPALSGEDYRHSRHVLQVFPRECRLVISEWSRAIRVAHSVRKTFILAIPGHVDEVKTSEGTKVPEGLKAYDYHVLGRIGEGGKQRGYALLCLHEDELLGGSELADSIEAAKQVNRDLLIGIVDRETSITYYLVKRIRLPGSVYQYYELEWHQP